MNGLSVWKGHGLGNDYLVLSAADVGGVPGVGVIRGLCDRHFGLGSDGLLVGHLDREPVGLRIYNPDGSEAEKSGNGLRIYGAWLYGRGSVGRDPFEVALARDVVTMEVLGEVEDGAVDIRVAMGRASFQGADVGFEPEPGEALESELDLGDGLHAVVNPVSTANPHCVVFVDALDRDDFLARAPRLATHVAFPAGTNVQFARVAGPDELEVWIWERGVGETLASGSSSCAAAAVATRLGLLGERDVTVRMRGGPVRVQVGTDFDLTLRGPAQVIYEARVPRPVLAGWAAAAP